LPSWGSGDEDALALLKSKLDDTDIWARERAATALGNLGERGTGAIPLLIQRLKQDPDYRVRIACARALGRLGPRTPSVAPALTAAAADPDERIQAVAKEALSDLGRE
jgi:HEAT repeat protein